MNENNQNNQHDGPAVLEQDSRAIYSSLEPEKELLKRLAELRRKAGGTQEAIAIKMGTSKSNISRLEKNVHSPTLGTLIGYIQALGYQFHLTITED